MALRRGGPGLPKRAALELRARPEEEWASYLTRCRSSADALLDIGSEADCASRLVARIVLQPYMAGLWEGGAPTPSAELSGRCPICRVPPTAGVLREDKQAETLRRTLLCSLCTTEWDYPRVLCPNCAEESPEKLPRYTAQEIPWIRVEACDSCGRYLKSVDLTREPEAEPWVDELGSTPLDLIARERGYAKIAPNLAGL